ncbi:hypothetical protein CRG98_007452, partial [Punica granatum]
MGKKISSIFYWRSARHDDVASSLSLPNYPLHFFSQCRLSPSTSPLFLTCTQCALCTPPDPSSPSTPSRLRAIRRTRIFFPFRHTLALLGGQFSISIYRKSCDRYLPNASSFPQAHLASPSRKRPVLAVVTCAGSSGDPRPAVDPVGGRDWST